MKIWITLILLSWSNILLQARNFAPDIDSSLEVISNSTYTIDCRSGMQDTFLSILSKEHIWFAQINETWGPNVYNTRYKIDTLESSIQNKNYSRVLSSDNKTGDDWRQTTTYIRESEGKLWVIDTTIMTQEICILDMNLDVGDQFSLTDSVLGFDNKLSVYKVDSIIDLNGQIRKVIYLSCDGGSALQYRWIEGIGPEVGVFSTSFQHCIIDGNISGLTCFYTSEALTWYNENYSQCWYSLVDTDMDASATWWDASYAGEWAFGDCSQKINITHVIKDTVINDRRCRVLGVTSDSVFLPESQLITFQKEGKFYFYEDDMWKLLYDFTAQIGDTVTYYISEKYIFFDKYAVPILPDQNILASNPYQLVVDKIDTIMDISGRPLLRYYTSNIIPNPDHSMGIIIENMGSQEKLFGNNTTIIPPECTIGEYVGLRCYSDDSTYIKLISKPCDMLTSIQNIYEEQIKIYPNPGQDILTITMSDEVYTKDTWQYSLYDLTGQIVKQGKLSGSMTTVDTDGLAVGIYMIRVYNGLGHTGTYKWVKM